MIQLQGLRQLPWDLPWVPLPPHPSHSVGGALPDTVRSGVCPPHTLPCPGDLGPSRSGLHTCILLTCNYARKALACEHIFVQ